VGEGAAVVPVRVVVVLLAAAVQEGVGDHINSFLEHQKYCFVENTKKLWKILLPNSFFCSLFND
jgi:hypothetical protein